jgi:hypothetical protein
MREIARELHADAVIEGSVTRSADRVRITVQLIDATSDQHLWSESYERELKNVLALQSQVAQAIAEQVHAVVTPEEQGHLSSNYVIDPDVYELYLKGRHIMERGVWKMFGTRLITSNPVWKRTLAALCSTPVWPMPTLTE